MNTDNAVPKPAAVLPTAAGRAKPRRLLRPALWTAAAAAVAVTAYTLVISRAPALFDVPVETEVGAAAPVSGAATAGVVIEAVDQLLGKPGGYLSNDAVPPMALLDNMPNWEFGVLTEVRDVVRSMRNDFGRAKSQSVEDDDLSRADAQFHFDHTHWMLPAAEDEYRQGQASLRRYLDRLQAGEASFYTRADNLNVYLATVEKRLGDLSQRLSGSVREPFMRELIDADGAAPPVLNATPWLEIDDVFFEARGYVWTLLHVLKAIEIDFAAVLEAKNAALLLRQIIDKLEHTQRPLFSPMVLNSTGFGMLSNHSLVMASYISRANAAVIDLRLQLSQG